MVGWYELKMNDSRENWAFHVWFRGKITSEDILYEICMPYFWYSVNFNIDELVKLDPGICTQGLTMKSIRHHVALQPPLCRHWPGLCRRLCRQASIPVITRSWIRQVFFFGSGPLWHFDSNPASDLDPNFSKFEWQFFICTTFSNWYLNLCPALSSWNIFRSIAIGILF